MQSQHLRYSERTARFTVPENFNIDEYTQSSFGVYHGKITNVEIWFDPEATVHIKEKKWHATQEIIEQKEKAHDVRFRLHEDEIMKKN